MLVKYDILWPHRKWTSQTRAGYLKKSFFLRLQGEVTAQAPEIRQLTISVRFIHGIRPELISCSTGSLETNDEQKVKACRCQTFCRPTAKLIWPLPVKSLKKTKNSYCSPPSKVGQHFSIFKDPQLAATTLPDKNHFLIILEIDSIKIS